MLMLALPPVRTICSSVAAKSCEISQMKTALPTLGGSCTIIVEKIQQQLTKDPFFWGDNANTY